MPLKFSCSGVCAIGTPVLPQLAGRPPPAGKLGLMICTGRLGIVGSPPIFTSAVATRPQIVEEPKYAHSAIFWPPDVCTGSEMVSACENILSPNDPVSRRRRLMFWHGVVLRS